MFSRTTRRTTGRRREIAGILGFINEIREIHQITDNNKMAIIVEQPSLSAVRTRVIVMHLSDRSIFYDNQFIGFPETLEDKTLTIDDDGEYIHLVISGPRSGAYFTLSPSQNQTAA